MPATNMRFSEWACDPRRSLEERFGAELLIENTLSRWKQKHGIKEKPVNYTAEQLRQKERKLNPGYEPCYSKADAARVGEILPELTLFGTSSFEDRPLRDISFLQFCPGLKSAEFRNDEIRDWSPLRHSQATLTDLKLWGTPARDLRVLGQLTKLEELRLYAHAPWPDMTGLGNLVCLRDFYFNGNGLALRSVGCLPQVRQFEVHQGYRFNVPLRSVADLPAMPELRRLHLENTDQLDGIERYSKLLNLEIFGYFTDLAPLEQLRELTHLVLGGGEYPTLAPLARMSELRRVVVRLEEPPDFTPLADAPRLHEIQLELSPVVPAELPGLNALLVPRSDEFAAPEPRPLAPLKVLLRDGEPDAEGENDGEPRNWGEDEEMKKSECAWLERLTHQRLTRLLGKGWGERDRVGRSGWMPMHVEIYRPEDLDRIPEIVQCLREILAATRHPCSYFFIVNPMKYYERDMDEIYEDEGEEFNAESEREEWEDHKERERERKEFLERKYRHRLRQESGLPTKPEDFAPPKAKSEEEEDTVAAGGVTDHPAFDLGTDISLYSTLTEKACYVNKHFVGGAEYYLGRKPETGD